MPMLRDDVPPKLIALLCSLFAGCHWHPASEKRRSGIVAVELASRLKDKLTAVFD